MTHPFSPYLFTSLGKILPVFTELTSSHTIRLKNDAKSGSSTMNLNASRPGQQIYSIPTRALIY